MWDLDAPILTNFQYYTKSPEALEELLERVVEDSLMAEGCSLKLTLPPLSENGETRFWAEWLKEDYSG